MTSVRTRFSRKRSVSHEKILFFISDLSFHVESPANRLLYYDRCDTPYILPYSSRVFFSSRLIRPHLSFRSTSASGPRARLSWHCQQLKLECSSRLPRSAETFRYDPWTLTLRTICGAFDGNNSKKWIGARESERLLPWSYRWWTLFGRLFFRECRISLRSMLQSLEREREI